MSKVKCDKCKETIEIELKVRSKGDLEISYFVCPKCNNEYIVLVTDGELRKLLAKVNTLRLKISRHMRSPKYFKYVAEYEKARLKAKKYADDNNLKELI